MSDGEFVAWSALAASSIRRRLLWFAALATVVTAVALVLAAARDPSVVRFALALIAFAALWAPLAQARRSPRNGELRVAADGTVYFRSGAGEPGVEAKAAFLSALLICLRVEQRRLVVWSDQMAPAGFRRLSAVLRWHVSRTADHADAGVADQRG